MSAPSALAVAGGLGVAAGTNLSEIMWSAAPVERWAAARAGGRALKIAENRCGGSARRRQSRARCAERYD